LSYLLKEGDALRESAFQRRRLVDFGKPIGKVFVHSPEDLILYKLMYLGLSGQPKDIRDISAILRAKSNEIDFEYITHWAKQLNLVSIWSEIVGNIK